MSIEVGQLLTIAVVIFGWWITNSQNNTRETRKEARSLSDGAKKLTVELSTLSLEYWMSDTEEHASEIKSQIELLEIELERFPLFTKGGHLMTSFLKFSDAVTGGSFESNQRQKSAVNAPEVLAVRRARNALLSQIEAEFRLHFCGLLVHPK